jgi:DNA-binding XRE family transcriptional regulator
LTNRREPEHLRKLAERVVNFRAENAMTQAGLANICGVSRLIILFAENEKPISLASESKITKIVGEF